MVLGIVASCLLTGLGIPMPRAMAEAVEVTGTEPQREIVLNVDGAQIGEILGRLAEQYGFQVKGSEKMAGAPPMSMNVKGSLEVVLNRLLRNRNYLIVRSADNASGIEKVVILDGSYGAAPPEFRGSPQGEDLIQALSGTP